MERRNRSFPAILLIFAALLLAGCGNTKVIPDIPPDELYRQAKVSMNNGNYENAIRLLRTIQARFPFDEFASQAQLDMIHTYVSLEDPESALDEADRFIDENPRHPFIDYAYYMKGMAFFGNDDFNFLQRWFKIDLAKRDLTDARFSFRYFKQLLDRYPNSRYAADAQQRMIALRNRIARGELYVADFYLERSAYVSAANRARYVIEYLPNTPSAPRALQLLYLSYKNLGREELAEDVRQVMLQNDVEVPNFKLDRKLKRYRRDNPA